MAGLSTDPYKGVRDFYPPDWAKMSALFSKIRETLSREGYEEYAASPLERAELYESKTSEEIVNEQTYTFTDRGDRKVTLRPEMTPTLARMVAHKRRELPFPLRWFSIPNVFRYERPQRGRLREHYQLNVDLLGLSSVEADLEIVVLAHRVLKAFGAADADFTIRISSRALLNAAVSAAGLSGEAAKRYVHLLDKKGKMTPDEFTSAARTLTDTDPLALIENASRNPQVAEEKKKLLDFLSALAGYGVGNAVFDPAITRGFDYYTGIVFEVFDTDTANARSLFGGGRYDNLVSLFDSEKVPAVGFGMGDVVLSDFLGTHGLSPKTPQTATQLYLGTPPSADILAAKRFADTLRKKGCSVFVNITDRSLGDQIKDAVKRGIPLFAAYGADEVANNTIRLKILQTGEELATTLEALPQHLKSGS